MKIAILGTGTWGTALGQVLADNGHDVVLYGRDHEQVNSIQNEHFNPKYFGKDFLLPHNIQATEDLKQAVDQAHYIVFAVPSNALRSILGHLAPLIPKNAVLINTAKGFDPQTKQRLSALIRSFFPKNQYFPIVSLIGPSFAEEVIRRNLTLVTSTCKKQFHAQEVAKLFSNDYFRVYAQKDEIGAEIGAAMKNVIAIASGIIEGQGYGDNARAALITRGLAEITKFGIAFGGKWKTFQGLTGLGDLTLTCTSTHSRNYRAGVMIGQEDSAETFLLNRHETIEGISATQIIHHLGNEKGIDLPIVNAVYQVLFERAQPSKMIKSLMARPLKDE